VTSMTGVTGVTSDFRSGLKPELQTTNEER
jgi:hypothetical protein